MQQILPLHLSTKQTIDNFIIGKNSILFNSIMSSIGLNSGKFFIWSKNKFGKTHVCNAFINYVKSQNKSALMIDCETINICDVDINQYKFMAFDNIEKIIGLTHQEEKFFEILNIIIDKNIMVLITSRYPLRDIGFKYKDISSRLSAMESYNLHGVLDKDLSDWLKRQLMNQGLCLTQDVSDYLLNRCSRDIDSLITIVDKLNSSSFIKKRKLTIPFVKEILSI